MLKILCETTMTAKPQMVIITETVTQQVLKTDAQVTNARLEDIASRFPDQLWSKHDTDVGLV